MDKIDRLYNKAVLTVVKGKELAKFRRASKIVPLYFNIVAYCYQNGIKEPDSVLTDEGRAFYSDMIKKLSIDVSEDEFFRYFEDGEEYTAPEHFRDESTKLLYDYLEGEKNDTA